MAKLFCFLPGILCSCDCNQLLTRSLNVVSICQVPNHLDATNLTLLFHSYIMINTPCPAPCNTARLSYLQMAYECIGSICPIYSPNVLTEAWYNKAYNLCLSYDCC